VFYLKISRNTLKLLEICSVSVLHLLEGSGDGDINVVGLLGGEGSKFGTKMGQMEGGDLLVKLLGEDVDLADFVFVVILVLPELDLSEDLVGEGAGHDERGMAGGATEVH